MQAGRRLLEGALNHRTADRLAHAARSLPRSASTASPDERPDQQRRGGKALEHRRRRDRSDDRVAHPVGDVAQRVVLGDPVGRRLQQRAREEGAGDEQDHEDQREDALDRRGVARPQRDQHPERREARSRPATRSPAPAGTPARRRGSRRRRSSPRPGTTGSAPRRSPSRRRIRPSTIDTRGMGEATSRSKKPPSISSAVAMPLHHAAEQQRLGDRAGELEVQEAVDRAGSRAGRCVRCSPPALIARKSVGKITSGARNCGRRSAPRSVRRARASDGIAIDVSVLTRVPALRARPRPRARRPRRPPAGARSSRRRRRRASGARARCPRPRSPPRRARARPGRSPRRRRRPAATGGRPASSRTGAPNGATARPAALGIRPLAQQRDVQVRRADLGLQRRRRALGDQLPVVDDPDAVGELIGLLEVLRGEEDGRALVAQPAHLVPQRHARRRVQARGRLVEEEHLGLVDQRHREVEPPAHAARVGPDAALGGLREPDALDQLRGARGDRARAGCRAAWPAAPSARGRSSAGRAPPPAARRRCAGAPRPAGWRRRSRRPSRARRWGAAA